MKNFFKLKWLPVLATSKTILTLVLRLFEGNGMARNVFYKFPCTKYLVKAEMLYSMDPSLFRCEKNFVIAILKHFHYVREIVFAKISL